MFMLPNCAAIDLGNPVAREHPLNRGLLSWWLPLPHTAGASTLFDVAGNRHGLLSGGPVWTAASPGRSSLSFDGVDDGADCGNPSTSYEQVTVIADITYASPAADSRLAEKGANSEWTMAWNITGGSGHEARFYNRFGSLSLTYGSFGSLSSGVRYHLVGVISSAGTTATYTNGVVGFSTGPTGAPSGARSGSVYVGYYSGGGPFYGAFTLHSLSVYDRAFLADEVTAHYFQTMHGYPHLLRKFTSKLWSFGGAGLGGGTVAPDYFDAAASRGRRSPGRSYAAHSQRASEDVSDPPALPDIRPADASRGRLVPARGIGIHVQRPYQYIEAGAPDHFDGAAARPTTRAGRAAGLHAQRASEDVSDPPAVPTHFDAAAATPWRVPRIAGAGLHSRRASEDVSDPPPVPTHFAGDVARPSFVPRVSSAGLAARRTSEDVVEPPALPDVRYADAARPSHLPRVSSAGVQSRRASEDVSDPSPPPAAPTYFSAATASPWRVPPTGVGGKHVPPELSAAPPNIQPESVVVAALPVALRGQSATPLRDYPYHEEGEIAARAWFVSAPPPTPRAGHAASLLRDSPTIEEWPEYPPPSTVVGGEMTSGAAAPRRGGGRADHAPPAAIDALPGAPAQPLPESGDRRRPHPAARAGRGLGERVIIADGYADDLWNTGGYIDASACARVTPRPSRGSATPAPMALGTGDDDFVQALMRWLGASAALVPRGAGGSASQIEAEHVTDAPAWTGVAGDVAGPTPTTRRSPAPPAALPLAEAAEARWWDAAVSLVSAAPPAPSSGRAADAHYDGRAGEQADAAAQIAMLSAARADILSQRQPPRRGRGALTRWHHAIGTEEDQLRGWTGGGVSVPRRVGYPGRHAGEWIVSAEHASDAPLVLGGTSAPPRGGAGTGGLVPGGGAGGGGGSSGDGGAPAPSWHAAGLIVFAGPAWAAAGGVWCAGAEAGDIVEG